MRALICALLLAAADPSVKLPAEVALGGPRKVSVSVSADGADYVLLARMLPVACFDDATNARVNAQRARLFALAGLARALSGKKDAELSVSGARVVERGKDGKLFTLKVRVPRDGITVLKPDEKPASKRAERVVALAGDLLTRKRDHEQILGRLAETLRADLDQLRAENRAKPDAETFAVGIAGLEEAGTANLERFEKAVRGDSLLLFTEKDDLIGAAEKERKKFLAALKRAVEAEDKP